MRPVTPLLLFFQLALAFGATLLSAAPLPMLGGKWSGTLKIPSGKLLQLQLHITDNNGKRTATLDIPTQNAHDIAVERVEVRGDSLHLQASAIRASFAGRIAPNGGLITGRWRQNGARLPLLLQRTSTAVVAAAAAAAPTTVSTKSAVGRKNAKRPQEPEAPFPYRDEEVRFANKVAGIQFAGTLTLPQGAGPFPAVVLLTGSGAQNRDQAVFGHRPFWVIADYLTRRGIAVLRFDDRGVGQSGGNSATATAADYATDAQAALDFLRTRREINGKHLGLVGHSEGGTAAIIATNKAQSPDFLVLLATPGVLGPEVIVRQTLDISRLKTNDSKILAGVEQRQRALLNIVQQISDDKHARARLIPAMIPPIPLPPEQAAQMQKLAENKAAMMTTPAYRFMLEDNPPKNLRTIKCPVLALNGSKDLLVAADPNLKSIEKALKTGGNRDVTVRELPGLNHLFQTAATGAVTEYDQIEETFSPTALRAIGDWVLARAK
ncbi:alpha/beta hydrolase family protein [Hymenobacter sp. HD11105]